MKLTEINGIKRRNHIKMILSLLNKDIKEFNNILSLLKYLHNISEIELFNRGLCKYGNGKILSWNGGGSQLWKEDDPLTYGTSILTIEQFDKLSIERWAYNSSYKDVLNSFINPESDDDIRNARQFKFHLERWINKYNNL